MKRGYLFILIATIAFSSLEVSLKFIAGEINSIQLTLTRFAIGALILAPLAIRTLKQRGEKLDKGSCAYFALLGFVGITLLMPILQMSISYTKSSVVAVLFSCNPIFITILAFFFLGEAIHRRNVVALILELVGTLIIIDPLDSELNMTGVVLCLVSTALFSIYSVMGKRQCARYGGVVVTCFSFLFGSLFMLILILVSHIPAAAQMFIDAGLPSFANIPILAGYNAQNLPCVLYVSVGVAGIGFSAYFLAMEYQPASVVSLVYFFKPILSPILAFLLHGEDIPFNMLLGLGCILTGSLANILPPLLEGRRAASQTQT